MTKEECEMVAEFERRGLVVSKIETVNGCVRVTWEDGSVSEYYDLVWEDGSVSKNVRFDK